MGVRGQLSGFPPPIIGSLVGTIRSQIARSRAKLARPAGQPAGGFEVGKCSQRVSFAIYVIARGWLQLDKRNMGCTSSAPNIPPSHTNSGTKGYNLNCLLVNTCRILNHRKTFNHVKNRSVIIYCSFFDVIIDNLYCNRPLLGQ